MASVWEERFKEEAEKTIPLQEVRIRIFGRHFFGIFGRKENFWDFWKEIFREDFWKKKIGVGGKV